MPEEKQQIIDFIKESKEEAEQSLRGRRKKWKELWRLYQNKQDYSQKSGWQSKTFVPKIYMAIEQASAMIKKAIVHTRRLFAFEPVEELDNVEKEKKYEKTDKRFKTKLEQSNFTESYSEMIKPAFLLGLGAIKTYWKNGLKFENIDVMDLFVDPTYRPQIDDRPRYVMERKVMDLAELKKMAKEVNEGAGEEVFDMKEIDNLAKDYKRPKYTSQERLKKGLRPYDHPSRNKVELWEYWGDVISKEGNLVEENQLIFIANEKHIIRQQDNPFKHNETPYNLTVPIPYPHRGVAGNSLVESSVKMQYTYNNILNMLVDNLNYSVNKTFAANYSNLMNPDKVTSLYPGKITWTQGDPRSALEEIDVTNIGNDIYNALKLINKEMQKSTAVTEVLMGMPTTEGRTTATEVEMASSQAKGLFNIIAKDLEEHSIQPILEKAYSLLVQFGDFPDVPHKFEVGGVTLVLDQKRQVEKITQILQLLGKNEALGQLIDTREIVKRLLIALDMEEVIKETEESPQQPQQQPQQRQQALKQKLQQVKKQGLQRGRQLAQQRMRRR